MLQLYLIATVVTHLASQSYWGINRGTWYSLCNNSDLKLYLQVPKTNTTKRELLLSVPLFVLVARLGSLCTSFVMEVVHQGKTVSGSSELTVIKMPGSPY